jgi:MoxR-like ATPase
MTAIRLVTSDVSLGDLVSRHLRASGFTCAVHLEGDVRRAAIRARPGLATDVAEAVAAALAPIDLARDAGEVSDADIEVLLGSEQAMSTYRLKIVSDNPSAAATIASELQRLHGSPPEVACEPRVERTLLRYGGANAFTRQVVRFLARRCGAEGALEHKVWPDSDLDVHLQIHDAAFAAQPARARFGVRIETDAPERVEPLRERLNALGYTATVCLLSGAAQEVFAIAQRGWVTASAEAAEIEAQVVAHLHASGVDVARFPLLPLEAATRGGRPNPSSRPDLTHLDMVLRLPLGQFLQGSLRPYGDDAADTWRVHVVTDHAARVQPLLNRLLALGFERPTVEVQADPIAPWRVGSAALGSAPSHLVDGLLAAMRDAAAEIAGRPIEIERRTWPNEPKTIRLTCMTEGLEDGSRDARVAQSIGGWNVVVHGGNASIQQALTRAGFRVRAQGSGGLHSGQLHHGGMPDALLERLRVALRPHLADPQHPLAARNAWPDHDRDCFVYLEDDMLSSSGPAGSATTDAPDLRAFVFGAAVIRDEIEPFLRVEGDRVFVAGVALDRREAPAARTPPASAYRSYVLDEATAELLRSLALAVRMGEPAALEGVSGASKTSSIAFLAALTRTPLWRVNLSGYSEPSELLGVHAPNSEGGGAFRWKDGPVLEAATHPGGAFLLLDEANLAAPEAIEVLNPLLERERTLVHPETGRPVDIDPGLRVFATGNAGYAGRQPQSPAWRNRLRAWHLVEAPTASELSIFLRASVLGEAPVVTVAGRRWRCPAPETPWRSLARAPRIDAFLDALARFHASAAHALSKSKDRATLLTRRDLASVLDFLVLLGGEAPHRDLGDAAYREALARYYLAPRPPGARAELLDLLDAHGVGARTWLPEAA